MENRNQKVKNVQDQEGWLFGIRTAFKGLWGTDVEMRFQHGGMKEEVEDAKEQIGRMSRGAENLLKTLNVKRPTDEMEDTLEDIVRDL